MPGMLSRSRSLRILKGGHKETNQQDNGRPAPPAGNPRTDFEILRAATPVSRTDSRVETPEMLQRPKTSGGPADHGKQFHKKVAPAPGPEEQKFDFPFLSPNKSTATILYAAELHDSREGIIGIALGSPTMNPNWNTAPSADGFAPTIPSTVTHISSNTATPAAVDPKQEGMKPKLRRWKSIFGKKVQPPQEQKQSFYQLAQSVMPARADSHHDNESIDSRTVSVLDHPHDESGAQSPPSFRPDIRESRKVPKGQEQPFQETRPRALTNPSKPKLSTLRSASSPQPPPKGTTSDSPTVPKVVVSGGSRTTSPQSLLDVDIPSIKMERYSVMFGNLLQPNATNSSSLLARRQGNAEKLKPLNELSVKEEAGEPQNRLLKPQRRATSPQPRSPAGSLSLFPQTNSISRAPSPRAASVHRPRPLQRSRTAPPSSPNRQSFAKELSEDDKSGGQESENEDGKSNPQLSATTPSSRQSFTSDSEDVPIEVSKAAAVPWAPRVNEPEWELVRKPSQRTALMSHPVSAPFEQGPSSAPLELGETSSLKAQAIDSAPRSANLAAVSTRPAIEEPQSPTIGTIGIARSISVSRATSPRSAELLRPQLVRKLTERTLSPAPSSERLVDKKPLTPTLVELRNRKSQRVQLVDA
ncbi:hypothetical protein K491DRAFT_705189 [Lophiostoma macrostomum CBS 122681]|uniref:Uncharacterized protein n=1 Tax=Lophiostoma macrostomum CBS 122681 TaxID=1314788 RepID=A0A6A6T3Z4_9PLEO|nr:hypothetical protein K491DRAFT_705189 [Lophiostoma macrostomum CBS 122681]